MKLLEAEPAVAPEVAPEAPRETPPEPPALPEAVPTCRACGAPMEPEQDWCLTCGTAAAGRLGQRPGLRAVSTIVGLTLALVLGAVAAGYAALKDDGNKPAQQASAPAASQPPAQPQAAPPAATQTPAPTQSTPPDTTTAPKSNSLPKVQPPKTSTSQGSPVTPVQPTTPSTPAPSTPTPSTSTPTQSTPTQTTPTQPAGPQPIAINGDAGTIYDPYKRAKAQGDPKRAIDDDASSSWYVDPNDPKSIGVGYLVNLGKLQGIREVDLQTSTPGFKVEVYATDEAQVPPEMDILDTRWSHITDASSVGAKDDGKQKIVLGAGTTKYRNLLLWFTGPPNPPDNGARLRLNDLKILG